MHGRKRWSHLQACPCCWETNWFCIIYLVLLFSFPRPNTYWKHRWKCFWNNTVTHEKSQDESNFIGACSFVFQSFPALCQMQALGISSEKLCTHLSLAALTPFVVCKGQGKRTCQWKHSQSPWDLPVICRSFSLRQIKEEERHVHGKWSLGSCSLLNQVI